MMYKQKGKKSFASKNLLFLFVCIESEGKLQVQSYGAQLLVYKGENVKLLSVVDRKQQGECTFSRSFGKKL